MEAREFYQKEKTSSIPLSLVSEEDLKSYLKECSVSIKNQN